MLFLWANDYYTRRGICRKRGDRTGQRVAGGFRILWFLRCLPGPRIGLRWAGTIPGRRVRVKDHGRSRYNRSVPGLGVRTNGGGPPSPGASLDLGDNLWRRPSSAVLARKPVPSPCIARLGLASLRCSEFDVRRFLSWVPLGAHPIVALGTESGPRRSRHFAKRPRGGAVGRVAKATGAPAVAFRCAWRTLPALRRRLFPGDGGSQVPAQGGTADVQA